MCWSGIPGNNTSLIHCHIFTQKLLFVALKQLQTTLWIVDALLFLIDYEQTCNHFEHSFLIDKCSCKMVNTPPSGIFNSSAISFDFNLRSAQTSLWSFLVFSGTTAKFGRPERSASCVSVRLCLKSAYHHLTIVSDGAESEQHLWSHCFAWTILFPSESNALSTHKIQIFPLFWKFATVASLT